MYIFNNYFKSLYKRSKSGFHRLTLLTIVLICSCAHIFSSSSHNTGGIYGKVTLNSRKKPLDNVKVRVEGTGLSTKVDSSGIFYIAEVPPGEYTLIATAPEFTDGVLEGVFVARDSISIVFIWLNESRGSTISVKEIWKGIKTGKVDINLKGKIKGHVEKSETSSLLQSMIAIENTFWVAYTDTLGEYQLINILPGKYTLKVFGMSGHYRSRIAKNVRVAPDSASIVDIELRSEFIPENLPPIEWEENIIKNSE